MSECEKCEYYDPDKECKAFECNGIECPDLPCEQWWIFTFGFGQKFAGKYVRIRGTYEQARETMFSVYGCDWAFQYSMEQWEKWKKDPNRCYLLETELGVIE